MSYDHESIKTNSIYIFYCLCYLSPLVLYFSIESMSLSLQGNDDSLLVRHFFFHFIKHLVIRINFLLILI